jgi:hypothetical protein
VSVLLGNGSGGFGAPAGYAAGASPMDVVVGDFNGDDRPDVAVADYTGDTVSVLLGNGSGGFGAPSTLATGYGPQNLVVGDFNGDGDEDLAVTAIGASAVSIYLGDGTGHFGAPAAFATGSHPMGMAVGDFNDDGKQDLAVASDGSSAVSVLLGDGSGGFGARTDFGTGASPRDVAVADFNGDGVQDLATADSVDGGVSVLLGDGGFGAHTEFAAASFPLHLVAADFSSDGKPDIAVTDYSSGNVSVLFGRFDVPAGSIRLEGGAAATATRAVTLDADFSEATQMRLRNAGDTWGEWTAAARAVPWTLSAGDGVKTVEAQFRNGTGTTAVLSDTILYDTMAPLTTDDAPAGWVTSSPVAVTLTAGDGAGSGVATTQYSLDNAASWSEGRRVEVAGDGVHTLRYRSIDAVGNLEDTEVVLVRVDATPPQLSVSGVDDLWHRWPVLALFSPFDAGSGVTSVSYDLDDRGWTAASGVLVSTDGDHTLAVKATDAAGNESDATVHVKIDTVGPVTSGLAASARAGKKTAFSVLVSDALGNGMTTSARVVIKGAYGRTLKTLPAVPVTIGTRVTVPWKCTLKTGTYWYVVYATDAAGNRQSRAGGNRLVVR